MIYSNSLLAAAESPWIFVLSETESNIGQKEEFIRAFLVNPECRRSFDKFFEFCFSQTKQYLRYLRACGWLMPLEKESLEDSLNDLSYDILGSLLASKRDAPFYIIFDYFKRHEIEEFAGADEQLLKSGMLILLRGFIKREIGEIRKLDNPLAANLKRSVDYCLEKMGVAKGKDASVPDQLFLKKHAANLRSDKEPLSSHSLNEIVLQAFNNSKTTPQWCSTVFELLHEKEEYQNCLVRSELISMMIKVKSEFVDVYSLFHGTIETPQEARIWNLSTEALDTALNNLRKIEIAQFEQKGRIKAIDSAKLLAACRRYLEDKYLNGGEDSIPTYFRLLLPDVSSQEYLKNYKYVFETLIDSAEKRIRQLLKEKIDR